MSKPLRKRRGAGRQTAVGRIGIFWWHNGRLLSAIGTVDEGETVSDIVDSKFTHIETWPDLQRHHPELRRLEYEDVPRGRVTYVPHKNSFQVRMDKTLFHAGIKAAILKAFQLPKNHTDFSTDPHYTIDQEEIDRLFDV